jgi:hypothetical protein
LDKITERELRILADAGSVREVQVLAEGRDWYVVAKIGMTEHVVGSVRQHRRVWKDLDRLVAWLRGLGIARIQLDATQHGAEEGMAS